MPTFPLPLSRLLLPGLGMLTLLVLGFAATVQHEFGPSLRLSSASLWEWRFYVLLYAPTLAVTALSVGYLTSPAGRFQHQVYRVGLALLMLLLTCLVLVLGLVAGVLLDDSLPASATPPRDWLGWLFMVGPVLYSLFVALGSRWLLRRQAPTG